MKELKMFPQITEETEENLLNLEEDNPPKSSPPYSSTPPFNPSSSSSSETPPETPTSPNHENQVPCPLPIVTTESTDRSPVRQQSPAHEEELTTPPPRTRMRSLSGGSYRLAPSLAATTTGRHRRQSGDDVLTRVSPSRRATLFDQFRPRSKSDSKGKRPTFLTTLKNSILGGTVHRKTSLDCDPPRLDYLDDSRHQRPRSGSDTKSGMSKMIDLFRSRSHSVSYDSRGKIVPCVVSDDTIKRKKRFFATQRSLDSYKRDAYSCHSEDETSGGRFEYGSLDDDKIIPTFLGTQTCYDVMLKSAKVVVLSTELLVRNAFNCLVTNEIHSAPLWESETFSFIGFLTITDFINVLRHYYYSPLEDIKSIENQTISTWRRITGIDKPLVKIRPNDSLVDATKLLIQERVHRLPVYDEVRNCVLSILTRKRLLQYLYKNLLEKMKQNYMKIPSFLNLSLDDLKPQLGTWENIAMVYTDTKVIEALNLFNERKVSVLPVLNKENKFVDIYSKFDVFALAKDQTYDNLNMKIKDAIVLAEHEHIHEIAYGCELKETLLTVIEGFVEYKCHRLLVHIDYTTVIGIISLSDILKFLVLPHAEEASISPDTIDETPEGAVGGSEDSSVFFDSKVDIHQPSTSKVDIHQPSTSKVDIHQPSTSKDDIQQPSTSKDSEQPKSAEKQDLSVISGDLEKLQLQAAILQSFSETSESEKS